MIIISIAHAQYRAEGRWGDVANCRNNPTWRFYATVRVTDVFLWILVSGSCRPLGQAPVYSGRLPLNWAEVPRVYAYLCCVL